MRSCCRRRVSLPLARALARRPVFERLLYWIGAEQDLAAAAGNLALAQDLHRARRALSVLRVRYGLAGEGVHT